MNQQSLNNFFSISQNTKSDRPKRLHFREAQETSHIRSTAPLIHGFLGLGANFCSMHNFGKRKVPHEEKGVKVVL